MKKSIIKAWAFLLAFILALSALTVGAGAVPAAPSNDDILFKAQEAPEASAAVFDSAAVVTGDFTATIPNNEWRYYKFVPAQTGCYNIYSLCDSSQNAHTAVYDDNDNWLDGSGDDEGRNFDLVLRLSGGSVYYFGIYLYGSNRNLEVKLEKMGTVESAEVISFPRYDTYTFDLNTHIWDDGYVIHLDYNGFEVEVTFEGGKVKTLYDWRIVHLFEPEYDKPAVGTHEIRFKSGGETIFTWNITIVEHPVRSIEVTKLPNKTTYIYNLEGDVECRNVFWSYFYPDYDFTGMEVKINYTNGTSRTVSFGKNWEVWVGDYGMHVDGWGSRLPGRHEMSVYYMNRTATFEVEIVRPTFFQSFYIGLMEVVRAVIRVIGLKIDNANDLIYWLRNRALGRA